MCCRLAGERSYRKEACGAARPIKLCADRRSKSRMNVLVSSAIAGAVTVSPVEAANPDAEIIAAGEKFKELLPKYMTAWFGWARLMRDAHAEMETKFGNDYGSPAWREPLGRSPAATFLHEAIARNGADRAEDALSALHNTMKWSPSPS